MYQKYALSFHPVCGRHRLSSCSALKNWLKDEKHEVQKAYTSLHWHQKLLSCFSFKSSGGNTSSQFFGLADLYNRLTSPFLYCLLSSGLGMWAQLARIVPTISHYQCWNWKQVTRFSQHLSITFRNLGPQHSSRKRRFRGEHLDRTSCGFHHESARWWHHAMLILYRLYGFAVLESKQQHSPWCHNQADSWLNPQLGHYSLANISVMISSL